ncbi:MAG: DUF58 domain-containing protein [Hyphomicrobiales bacterium]|nr:DUF58 domain-containing protein [Hyphomicrobiales bacterium]MCP5371065.1 DUF58 domain-containing protein [Hyphomicrobiales bacterium]
MAASRSEDRDRAGLRHQAEALASTLPALLVAADRVASTVSQGVHGRRRVGQGETFWQFRRYQAGDSVQDIDWRQSAKSQPVYVRETEWEAAQSVWLWRDGSPSMDFRSAAGLPLKRGRADLLLLALASLLVRGGERVALLGQDRTPRAGRAALNHLAASLEAASSPTASLPPRVALPRFARVVLFGDFLSTLDEIGDAVRTLTGTGLRGHLVQVLDPAEESLPYDGRAVFEGVEGDGDLLLGRVETVREDYRRLVAERHAALSDLARSVQWTFTTHHTDRPPEAVLLSLYLALAEGGKLTR